jgi:hypothetical protein
MDIYFLAHDLYPKKVQGNYFDKLVKAFTDSIDLLYSHNHEILWI